MKEAMTMRDLAMEVRRRSDAKHDYWPRTNEITMSQHGIMAEAEAIASRTQREAHAGWPPPLDMLDEAPIYRNGAATSPTSYDINFQGKTIEVGGLAHDQLATHLGIPARYYSRLEQDFPSLLTHNVNTLLAAAPETEVRMVRTLDGRARAFLSNAYASLDNWDLLRFLLPLFAPTDTPLADGTSIKSLRNPDGSPLAVIYRSNDITDDKMYVKIIAPTIQAELRVGQTIRAGVIIQNSEVGLGTLSVLPFYEILQCTNGAFFTQFGTKRRHVGQRVGSDMGAENDAARFFSDATKRASDKAFFMRMADVVRGTLTEVTLNKMLVPMRASMDVALTGNLSAIVEQVGRQYEVADEAQDAILRYLIDGGDLSIWGLSNAVTRYSQDVSSYDTATDLERIGGSIITLGESEWDTLATTKRSSKRS